MAWLIALLIGLGIGWVVARSYYTRKTAELLGDGFKEMTEDFFKAHPEWQEQEAGTVLLRQSRPDLSFRPHELHAEVFTHEMVKARHRRENNK